MNLSPRSRAHPPSSRQPVGVRVQESLLAMQSFADEVTVESPFDGLPRIAATMVLVGS